MHLKIYRNTQEIATIDVKKSGPVKFKGYAISPYLNLSSTIGSDVDISINSTGDFVADSSFIVTKSVGNQNILIR